jgi:Carboxypeptidase regulatory-like domain/TonB dependent receptor-like, beta-barrel
MSAGARRWLISPAGVVLAAFVLVLAVPSIGMAQVLYGSILGDVKDATGGSVSGAVVVVTNQATNLARQGVTDTAGRFHLADLPAGVYSFKATQKGFKTFEQTEVTVSINSVTRVDVTLQIGSIGDTVTVNAEPPQLQTDTSEVHVNLRAAELSNLPVPLGRNYQQVYRMLPGFAPPFNSHSIPTNPARSLEFTVNGTSDDQNNTRIDGVSTTHIQLPHVVSYIPTLESIQEVNVVTNSMDAEQGLAGGAAVNVQTKSGSNSIRGSAFEYHTDEHLKAWPMRFDDAALNTGNKPKMSYNQYGGTVGGPIKKNKIFYFASYESTRDHKTVDRTVSVPLPAMLRGDLSLSPTPIYDPLSGNRDGSGRTQFRVLPGDANYALCNTATNPNCLNIIPAARMDAIAKRIAGSIPANNLERERDNYFVSGPFTFDRHQIDSRVDYNVSPKLNLTGTFGFLHYRTSVPTVFGEAAVGRPIGGSSNPGHGHGNTYRLTVMGTYAFSPNFLMDAHYGWARQGTASEQPGLGRNVGSEMLGIPGTNGTRAFESGWPTFEFEDFATVGLNENFMPYYRQDPQSQYVVNLNLLKRKHNIRFGGDIYRMALNQAQAEFLTGGFGAQGGFGFDRGITLRCEVVDPATGNCEQTSRGSRYNSVAAFVLGQGSRAGRTLQVPDEYHVRAWLFSAYARDRWTPTDKLTIDYGTRWEYFPVPSRPDRGIERYDVDTGKVLLCGVGSVPGDCDIEVSKTSFGPRLGVAYRVSNKWVARAGYGLTNDPYEAMELIRAQYPILIQVQLESPNGLTPARSLSQGIPAFQVPPEGNGILDIPSNYAWTGYPKKLNRGYIQSWNVTVQRELPWSFTGQVGYVATRSVRQLGNVDINAGQVIGAGEDGRPLLAKFGRTASTIFVQPVGTGRYDSLQAQLQRRFVAGLALGVSYTWGKAISPNENSSGTPNIQALPYIERNRALTSSDRTHNIGITNVWQIPLGEGKRWLNDKSVAARILGGWQINNMVSMMSGVPFSVFADGTSLNLPGSNQTADQVKTTVQKLGGVGRTAPYYDPTAFAEVTAARFGNTGYNMLRGPGLFNWDFGLQREFSLTGGLRLQLRLESFNFTNTPHLATPDNNVGDGEDFMTITSVQDLGREGIDERQFRLGIRVVF